MLTVEQVEAGYDDITILNGISLQARKGQMTLLIGPNGAGKSTLLKTIFGLIRPAAGSILFEENNLTALAADRRAQLGIGYLLQRVSVFPELSIEENLKMGAYSFRSDTRKVKARLENAFDRFPFLREKRQLPAGLLSGGQKRMAEIARTLMIKPKLMLVDEPSAGLSPKMAKEVYQTLHQLKEEENITFLLVDQNVREAVKIADYVYVLERGKVSSESPAGDIEKNLSQVVESWLKF